MNLNLFKLADELHIYLRDAGIEFTEDGYPLLTESMLLKEMPQYVIPITHTYAAHDKSKTLLVSFSNDENVYKRLLSLHEDIPMYKEYLGIAGFDLSPRIQWDINLQKFNILLSRLADVYLAINGIKIMPNFRVGRWDTFSALNIYPKNSWYAVGTLGCAQGKIRLNEFYLRMKLLLTNPDMLIYYGKLKEEYRIILDEMCIPYKVFADFQRVSRGKEAI